MVLFINYVQLGLSIRKFTFRLSGPQRIMGLCHVRSDESAAVPLVKHSIRHFII